MIIDSIPRELTRTLLDALGNDATLNMRREAFNKLCDLIFAPTPDRFSQVDAGEMADFIQMCLNDRAVPVCPLEGQMNKPQMHARCCSTCRMRELLTPGWFLRPERAAPAAGETP